jgi:hypothetical protein
MEEYILCVQKEKKNILEVTLYGGIYMCTEGKEEHFGSQKSKSRSK